MFGLFLIPKEFEEYVIRSWENDEPSVYGRFDLAYDGVGAPKMLEYNADTPTALVEAAVAQWVWLKDVDERADQFNSIHEQLIDAWKDVLKRDSGPIHFAAMRKLDTPEDYITAEYMRDTAIQAGAKTSFIDMTDIGWDRAAPRVRGQHRLPDPPLLQAVSVGVDGQRGVRAEHPHRDHEVGRTGVEDDPQLQEHSAAPVRAAPETARSCSRRHSTRSRTAVTSRSRSTPAKARTSRW